MDIIFMHSKNSKTSDPHWLEVNPKDNIKNILHYQILLSILILKFI